MIVSDAQSHCNEKITSFMMQTHWGGFLCLVGPSSTALILIIHQQHKMNRKSL